MFIYHIIHITPITIETFLRNTIINKPTQTFKKTHHNYTAYAAGKWVIVNTVLHSICPDADADVMLAAAAAACCWCLLPMLAAGAAGTRCLAIIMGHNPFNFAQPPPQLNETSTTRKKTRNYSNGNRYQGKQGKSRADSLASVIHNYTYT